MIKKTKRQLRLDVYREMDRRMSTPKFDPASVEQLRREVEAVPPQKSPRAAKALTDLKAAVSRLQTGR